MLEKKKKYPKKKNSTSLKNNATTRSPYSSVVAPPQGRSPARPRPTAGLDGWVVDGATGMACDPARAGRPVGKLG